jgi:hypothetical protein
MGAGERDLQRSANRCDRTAPHPPLSMQRPRPWPGPLLNSGCRAASCRRLSV